jgi:phenylacetate-CoA ligase
MVPLYDFATRTPTRKYLRELDASQWFSLERIQKLQEKKLRFLIKYAYDTVPYYHKLFRVQNLNPNDIKSVDDLVKLPILSRNEVREEPDSLISRDYQRAKVAQGCTGGSTGEPIKFYTTKENRGWSMAARYLAWRWAGFEIGDKYAHVFGSPLDRPRFASLNDKLQGTIKRRIFIDAYQLSEKKMESFTRQMRRFKPKILYGFAEAVSTLAKFIEEREIKPIPLKSVIIDSSSLFKHEINTIENVFCCKVWWNYHNRENGTFGSECSEHDGYHLFAQNFVFEFTNNGGRVAPGEKGAIVITDLTNYAMPFIRYEVGDVGIPSDETCSCGRDLPLMRKLFGRTADILVSATGELIVDFFYVCLERLFETGKIKQYQILQETPTQILMKIIPGKNLTSADISFIKKAVLSLMGDMKIEVRLVDAITTNSSGKRQTVIRKFPIEFSK